MKSNGRGGGRGITHFGTWPTHVTLRLLFLPTEIAVFPDPAKRQLEQIFLLRVGAPFVQLSGGGTELEVSDVGGEGLQTVKDVCSV